MIVRSSKIGLGLGLVVVLYIVKLLWDAGLFVQITPLHSANCHRLFDTKGIDVSIKGAEDIARLNDDTLLLSVYDRHNNTNGQLFWVDSKSTIHSLSLPLSINDFAPHGMDIWQANGETLVYVINHTKEGDRLEVFKVDFSEKKLLLNTVLSRKLPKNANDISVVKRDQWFISFDHLGEQAWQHKLEDYLRLPLSYIALVSPKGHNIVSKGHRYANGVYYDSNKKLLYVAAMLDRRLSTYQYDEHKQRLVLVDRLNHLGGVDNIMSSPTGNTLWVASHPQLLKLSSMRASANKLSPSRVWEVSLDDEGLPIDASSLFVDKGDTFSASSVALVIDTDLYIGSVFDRGLLRCPVVMAK